MGELGANWHVADMKPGSAPLRTWPRLSCNLESLQDLWSGRTEELAMLTASLRRSDRSLVNLISQVKLALLQTF